VTTVAAWDELLAGEELAHLSSEPTREASKEPLPDDLHPRVRAALAARGIDELFSHQSDAWRAARDGEHVAISAALTRS
jgi:ATP-dependent helicase YprA (DUF1998 family)